MGQVNIEVPEDTHRKFSALASLRGNTMKEELIETMQREVDDSNLNVEGGEAENTGN